MTLRGKKLQIPTLPSFIKLGEVYVSLSEFSEEDIKDIGKAWTAELSEKARRMQQFGLKK